MTRFGRDLPRRVGTALVALPAVVAVVVLAPPAATVALVAAALIAAALELWELIAARGLHPERVLGTALGAALFADVALRPGRVPLWPALLVVLLAAAALRRRDPAESFAATAATAAGAVYLGALGGTLAALRTLDPVAEGPARVLLLLGVVMAADTGAYFTGHALGRRRLAPIVSPNKTVEGALGGLAGGALAGVLAALVAFPGHSPVELAGLGLVVAALGTVGDLFESLLKRWAGVKDSGRLFPGHGGMLDRLDSLLFAAPLLYYFFLGF